MKLNDFLATHDTSMGAFAKTVGTTTATISRIADGIVVPRKALMGRIYKATEGLVTPNDLVGLYCVSMCQSVGDTQGKVETKTALIKTHIKPMDTT